MSQPGSQEPNLNLGWTQIPVSEINTLTCLRQWQLMIKRPTQVILTAIDFGFGPGAALCYLLNKLRFHEVDSVVIDIPSRLLPVVSDEVPPSWTIVPRLGSSLTISNDLKGVTLFNFGRLDLLTHEQFWRTHYLVDCVGWLTKPLLPPKKELIKRGITHVVECFPPVDKELWLDEASLIRPCVSDSGNVNSNGTSILLTIGGGNAPGIASHEHPLTQIVAMILKHRHIKTLDVPVFVTGGTSNRHSFIRSVSYTLQNRMIRDARMVISAPGLYGVFEALQAQRPVLLLPPTNYTQYIQYKWYVAAGLVPKSLDWTMLLNLDALVHKTMSRKRELQFTTAIRRRLVSSEFSGCVADTMAKAIQCQLCGPPLFDHAVGNQIFSKYVNNSLPRLERLLYE